MILKINRIKSLIALGFKHLKENGFKKTVGRTLYFLKRRLFRGNYLPKEDVLAVQRVADTTNWPKISLCVPLYNTPSRYLEDLLNSVLKQTYTNFELCLADASDAAHSKVKQLVELRKDERIKYISVKNLGISTNTNAAASLATGEYLALADHDDILSPNAFYEVAKAIMQTNADFIYSDEALFTENIKSPIVGHFKPDYSPDYLLSCNYICHLAAFKRSLFDEVGGFRSECDGSQDHDLFFRLIEKSKAVWHIPKVLYYWRVHSNSTSSGTGAKPYVKAAAIKAINDHLARTNVKGHAVGGMFDSTYKVEYDIDNPPLVSILIPNFEHKEDLKRALNSIYDKTSYENFEIIVIENNSKSSEIFDYYKEIEEKYSNLTVVKYDGEFNFSAINNYGRTFAKGEYILFLNNDIEVINSEWLSEMVAQGIQPRTGIVGAMLYYNDDTIQHAGVITGLGGFAGHSHKYKKKGHSGYMFRTSVVQNFSAVTAACMLVRTEIFDAIDGFDEDFKVAFNDVDFCLRVRNLGCNIVFTPYAELYHFESKSRGLDTKGEAKKRFDGERERLLNRYGDSLTRDPFYNPSLTLDREDFSQNDVLPEY